MTVLIPRSAVDVIRAHGRAAYPEEGCGFLIGKEGTPRRVEESRPARNVAKESRTTRYDVDPADTFRLTKELRGTGREIVGFFHSHPDHPARPSEFDRSRAWTWYTYVIVSVEGGKAVDLRAWVLEETEKARAFREEDIQLI
ncbi:MAG: hypothetical protein A3K65_02865 [Euryarchaeota archaeon RBG_16_68_12]|nr:MAG: hypothetical protein A3K65_02865 [Euryarchaeota archaeon RBG_16_68_12]